MKPGFWDLVRAAFHARPLGMFVPPNWVGLGAFGLLGLVNPGFWIIGAGLELAYLGLLVSRPRFQRLVSAEQRQHAERRWDQRLAELVRQLDPADQRRYRLLEVRCRSVLDQQLRGAGVAAGVDAQAEGLGKLVWIYLKLLWTRQSMARLVRGAVAGEEADLTGRITDLEGRLKEASLSDELRRSLDGQLDILRQRVARRAEARDKLAFLDAELARVEEQVELIREQAVLATSPEAVSQRIDQVTATLGGTTQWIQEQQQIYGAVEDLLSEPPPLAATGAKESQ